MNRPLRLVLPLLLTSGGALADDAGFLRCRAIAESAARLACYDALVPTASQSAPAAQPQAAVQQFGREQKPAPPSLDAIESQIPGVFEGWRPGTRIRLANGQVWQVTDDSTASYRLVDPKVRVKRGTLGSFFLELVDQNRSLRVRRVE